MIFAVAALFLSALACGGSFSTANIANAWLSTDEQGDNYTTTFSQNDQFNFFLELKNAPSETKLKASWIAVNAEGLDPNHLIYESEYTSGDDTIHFYLTNDQLWPVGSYKVDVYLNNKLDRSLESKVQ